MTRRARTLLQAALLLGATVVIAAGSAGAAIPEFVYRDMQNSAPEFLHITVLSVDKPSTTRPYDARPGGTVTTINVTMTAKVDGVLRTDSGLTPGAVIVVRYTVTHQSPPTPGPQEAAILSNGEKARAYLVKLDVKTYGLAAEGGSLLKR
jgi:hypothetical protein